MNPQRRPSRPRTVRPVVADSDYPDRLLTAALTYAERGWHVFPLRPGTKRPAVPNHPAHHCDQTDPRCRNGHAGWEARATTNPDRITTAWRRRPYGIGIACGPSGLLVVDLDTATTTGGRCGADTWGRLTHNRPVVVTRTVATPSGGRHRYYQRPAGIDLGNTASRLGPRVDTRANGGYVVAPPTSITTTHGETGRYWVTCGTAVAEAPGWLIDALTAPPLTAAPGPQRRPGGRLVQPSSERVRRYVAAAINGEIRRLQTATAEGTRNQSLFLAAIALGQLVGAGLIDQDTAEQVLWANTTHHLTAGAYTCSQAAATIASGLNRGIQDPRQLPTNLTNMGVTA